MFLPFTGVDFMPLPDLIEVAPLRHEVTASVSVPGSKSITNRALILAALATGKTELRHALWSEDTQVMVACLQQLGFEVHLRPDTSETGNRHISVLGLGGEIPRGGTAENPLELFVGNAGTAARFLAAMVCLGEGYYRLSGVARMHQRPQAALFHSLRQLGYEVQSDNDKLPAMIRGEGPKPGECLVSIDESSQFASALLLSATLGKWQINVIGDNSEESPYVTMTSDLIATFPPNGGIFEIEPDASSASYIWAADWLLRRFPDTASSKISVADWMNKSLQIDAHFPEMLRRFPAHISRQNELGDSIMTAIVLASFADQVKEFTDLGRLRVQECERVQALRTELAKCGAVIEERGDTLRVTPGPLRGATIHTYNDHRLAMCFGTLALKVPGIKIENPSCVKKTFPNFFQKLATQAPNGLAVQVFNAATGQLLQNSELFAE
jgi:3-phosphoshikimate 1-carboxyvinyltransferase